LHKVACSEVGKNQTRDLSASLTFVHQLQYIYTVIHENTRQYIYDHNSVKSWWILVIFTYLETEMNALCK